MRDLKVEEVEAVSGADGISPPVGIGLVLTLIGTAIVVGVATPLVVGVGIGSVAVMSLIAAGQATQSAGPDKKGGGS